MQDVWAVRIDGRIDCVFSNKQAAIDSVLLSYSGMPGVLKEEGPGVWVDTATKQYLRIVSLPVYDKSEHL